MFLIAYCSYLYGNEAKTTAADLAKCRADSNHLKTRQAEMNSTAATCQQEHSDCKENYDEAKLRIVKLESELKASTDKSDGFERDLERVRNEFVVQLDRYAHKLEEEMGKGAWTKLKEAILGKKNLTVFTIEWDCLISHPDFRCPAS